MDVTGRDDAAGHCGFDAAWTARRIGDRLFGARWGTVRHGRLRVTGAEPEHLTWPIALRLTVVNDDWPAPRIYRVQLGPEDTFACTSPEANACDLAENTMHAIEQHLDGVRTLGVVELTRPRLVRP